MSSVTGYAVPNHDALSNIQIIFYIISLTSAMNHFDEEIASLEAELQNLDPLSAEYTTKRQRLTKLETESQSMHVDGTFYMWEKAGRMKAARWTVCQECDESHDDIMYQEGNVKRWYHFQCDICKKEARLDRYW